MRINDFFQRMGIAQQPSAKPIPLNPNIDQSHISTVTLSTDVLLEGPLKDWGGKPSPELREVLKQFLSVGRPLNKEMVQLMDQIMQKGEGTPQQKQEVFRLIAQKNINLSLYSYKAVFQALHGPSLESLLDQLSDHGESFTTINHMTGKAEGKWIQKLDLLVNMLQDRSHVPVNLEQNIAGLKKEIHLSQLHPSKKEKLNQLLSELVLKESSTSNLIQREGTKDSLNQQSIRPSGKIESALLPQAHVEPLENTTQTPSHQVEEAVGNNPLLKIENLLKEIQQSNPEMQLSTMQSATFSRIMEYIPQHLRKVGEEFTEIKKQVIQNIDRMTQFMDQKIPQAESYVKRVIEPTIDLVNRLINKGEFALHADMEFEHDVLRISSELQKVKGMLEQGDQKRALESFQSLRKDLEKLHWQPSITKVESFFSKWTGDQTPGNPLMSFAQDWQKGEITGRVVQEWMRDLGLSHERDALDFLIHRNKKEDEQSLNLSLHHSKGVAEEEIEKDIPRNMKSWLMDNMEKDTPARAKQAMEQALTNVTGQQLLSKPEQNTQMQTMYVQLPLPWEDRTRTVKMEIHSRSQGEKMDWENCHLFFYLDTPKFGETGISVQVMNRDITLKFQNDHEGVESFFSPYIPLMEESLKGIGYRINKVQFESVQQDKVEREQVKKSEPAQPKSPYSHQKGLDLSI